MNYLTASDELLRTFRAQKRRRGVGARITIIIINIKIIKILNYRKYVPPECSPRTIINFNDRNERRYGKREDRGEGEKKKKTIFLSSYNLPGSCIFRNISETHRVRKCFFETPTGSFVSPIRGPANISF